MARKATAEWVIDAMANAVGETTLHTGGSAQNLSENRETSSGWGSPGHHLKTIAGVIL